jgi:site-specific DNA recombinase
MKDLTPFKSFAHKDNKRNPKGINAVIYTRVSHHSQEDNTSLESQKKFCESFAEKKGLHIINHFGGTYESAKTDDRKEFNRMLSFVKRTKDVTYVIVYSYDRFSRSGMGGAQIADELLKKYGVITLAVTQELDPTTSSGSFQQKILFLFSQMDNEQRKDKTVTGMRELIQEGYFPFAPPVGYTNLNRGQKADKQKIVLNETGKMIQKAFLWKANQQMRNSEIVRKLQSMGTSINERRLGQIFANPFYCGLLVSKLIPNELFEGKHEPAVSKEIFLKINNIVLESRNHPVTHKEEDEHLPLKRYMKCKECETPMTGYLVQKKGLYYYKCRKVGCKNNKSAKQAHEQFMALMSIFRIDECDKEIIKTGIKEFYNTFFEELFDNTRLQKAKITELQNKIDTVEENHAIGKVTTEVFNKYASKYKGEIYEIEKELQKITFADSNLEKCLKFVVNFCVKPNEYWQKAEIGERTILQNIIFPNGIIYDRKNDTVRTNRVNSMFAPIPELLRSLRGNKKGETIEFDDFSFLVTPFGFEPKTYCLEGSCSIQLSYGADKISSCHFKSQSNRERQPH